MELNGDENFHQLAKRSKPVVHSPIPSIDSILEIPTLPPELVTEILSRLPVKSLLKFRSVSKSWLSLISNPEFIKTHLTLSANNKENIHHRVMLRIVLPEGFLKNYSLSSLLYDSVVDASDMNPVESPCGPFRIVGSVNGLIFLARSIRLLIWNPSIKKYKKLPSFRNVDMGGLISCTYGFGYDEIHDDYKVVGVRYPYQRGSLHHFEVKVYSLKSDSWRNVQCPQNGVKHFRESGKFVNGKLHWATTSDGDLHRGWSIISIDLASEKWGVVELPCYGEGNGVFSLGVYGSNLSMVCTDPKTHVDVWVVDVWVMRKYDVKESWTKMFTVKYPPVKSPDEQLVDYQFYPSFWLINTGEILLIFGSVFMIYNPKDGSTRYPKYTESGLGTFGVGAEIYFESLVCPLSQNELRARQG